MIIGIPKEIKNHEYRVGLTPSGAKELISAGHQVIVEQNAGIGAGFSDSIYQQNGCLLVSSAKNVFEKADIIVKVKEPQPEEYPLIKPEHIVFTYFHFAASKQLTDAMIASKAVCIAYETIKDKHGQLPLLVPMSQIAGRLSVQIGAHYLLKQNGGSGTLLGGVPGVEPGTVVILGGGTVGEEAARISSGMGAHTYILDINPNRLNYLSKNLPSNVSCIFSNRENIEKLLPQADIIVGAVLIPGGKAPILISKNDLSKMKKGSVVVDVAVDQGGCIETIKPTTHKDPVYVVDGIIHYGVANMPGSVARTSTLALTANTLPYIKALANNTEDLKHSDLFNHGVEIYKGEVLNTMLI